MQKNYAPWFLALSVILYAFLCSTFACEARNPPFNTAHKTQFKSLALSLSLWLLFFLFYSCRPSFSLFSEIISKSYTISHATRNILKHRCLHFIKITLLVALKWRMTGHGPSNTTTAWVFCGCSDSLLFYPPVKVKRLRTSCCFLVYVFLHEVWIFFWGFYDPCMMPWTCVNCSPCVCVH